MLRALGLAWRAAPVQVAAYLGAAVLGGVAPLAAAWLMKVVIDRLAAGTPAGLGGPAALLAVTGAVAAVVPPAARYLRGETDRRVVRLATARLYAAVDRFTGLRRFEEPAFLDRLQIARSAGVGAPGLVVESGLGAVQAAVTVAGFAAVLLRFGAGTALVVVASAVPALLAELWLSRRRADMVARTGHAERREMFYGNLLTDAQAAKEIRLFGAGRYLWRRMAAEIRTIHSAHRRTGRRELSVHGGLSGLGAAVAGGLLLWAVHRAAAGVLSVGDVALVVGAVAAVQGALAGLVTEAVSVHQAVLMFGHYAAVVDAGPDLPVRAKPRPVPPLRGGVELCDVWFRYAGDQPWILRGADLVLPAGRTTALVGLNGAGKTTLVKLLCRLYDPAHGAVRWDGVDLRDVDPVALRRRIRVVFQDAHAYDLTARENIAIGDLDALADPARIAVAAGRAGIHAAVAALPNGYDTMLSRMFTADDDSGSGVGLSGGQWQRLAIARGTVLDDPDLLVLDEPSSALDAEAEADVHARLRELRRGRTTLLISHRLGVVRGADHIVVLSGGAVTERGTHDELVARGGAYARLFEIQAAGYRVP